MTIPAERRDPELSEKLKAEWPGILQWMIEGCADWQEFGLALPAVVTGGDHRLSRSGRRRRSLGRRLLYARH